MTRAIRDLLVPALFTLVAGTLLIGLGVWQLHRLAWKETILAQIETRTKAPAQPLPANATWPSLAPDAYEYRHVALDGTFRNDKETHVFRAAADGPGYLVLTPLSLRDGGTVIVNRGFVPADLEDRAKRQAGEPKGPVHIVGFMRSPEARNLFTPSDEPERGVFFTRDPQLIASRFGLTDAAPFTVDADGTPNPGGWPRGGTTVVAIPNNHLQYALTWFGLALGLFGVFLAFAWRRLHQRPEARGQSAPTAGLTLR